MTGTPLKKFTDLNPANAHRVPPVAKSDYYIVQAHGLVSNAATTDIIRMDRECA